MVVDRCTWQAFQLLARPRPMRTRPGTSAGLEGKCESLMEAASRVEMELADLVMRPNGVTGSRALSSSAANGRRDLSPVVSIFVRVRQYAYLGVRSNSVDPGVISERLGLMPDEVKLRGSRHQGPSPAPRTHLWRLESGVARDDVPLDEHFDALLVRLADSASRLRDLLETEGVRAAIQVFRNFEPGPEGRAVSEPGRHREGFERLRGQHPLVGFGIAPKLVAYAAEAGIGFDFDEYGDEDE